MRFSTKLGKIKLMRLITKANTDSLFLTIYFSINGVQERSTKDNGKIGRVFYFRTQDFNISNNPIGDIVSLLTSLIVTSMSSISAGAMSFIIS